MYVLSLFYKTELVSSSSPVVNKKISQPVQSQNVQTENEKSQMDDLEEEALNLSLILNTKKEAGNEDHSIQSVEGKKENNIVSDIVHDVIDKVVDKLEKKKFRIPKSLSMTELRNNVNLDDSANLLSHSLPGNGLLQIIQN